MGNCTIASSTTNTAVANANPIRYRGYYYDDDTGLYYCNARYYSPMWRRFISPDNTSYLDPESVNGLNLYCYCGNDPVNYCDPSGNSPTKWWEWALAGLAVAGLFVGAVFTGGLLYGAFLGAAIGASISLGTQAIQGELNWSQFALDTGVGAITGMLGVSSVSRRVVTGLGAVIGGTSNLASQFIQGATWDEIILWEVAFSVAVGCLAGFAGGAGARNAKEVMSATKVNKAMSSLTKVLDNIVAGYYPSAQYAEMALSTTCKRLGYAIIRQQTSMLTGSMLCYGVSTAFTNFITGVF